LKEAERSYKKVEKKESLIIKIVLQNVGLNVNLWVKELINKDLKKINVTLIVNLIRILIKLKMN